MPKSARLLGDLLEQQRQALQRLARGFVPPGTQNITVVQAGGGGGGSGGGGVTDHGLLTGLADDDHPQYTTDAEADAIADGLIATHAADADAHAGKVTHHILFRKTGSLTLNVPLSPQRVCIGEAGEHGTITAIRATATCKTIGGGTNTLKIQVHDDPSFGATVTLFTIPLDTAVEATVVPPLDNAWDIAGGYIWVECMPTAVNAASPQDVEVDFAITEAVC